MNPLKISTPTCATSLPTRIRSLAGRGVPLIVTSHRSADLQSVGARLLRLEAARSAAWSRHAIPVRTKQNATKSEGLKRQSLRLALVNQRLHFPSPWPLQFLWVCGCNPWDLPLGHNCSFNRQQSPASTTRACRHGDGKTHFHQEFRGEHFSHPRSCLWMVDSGNAARRAGRHSGGLFHEVLIKQFPLGFLLVDASLCSRCWSRTRSVSGPRLASARVSYLAHAVPRRVSGRLRGFGAWHPAPGSTWRRLMGASHVFRLTRIMLFETVWGDLLRHSK